VTPDVLLVRKGPTTLNNADWKEAWRSFELARDLDPGERRKLLASTPPHSVEEVEAMIEAAGDADLDEPPAPGRDYGKYTLLAPLGSGGMGEVFSARDRELGRTVTIKFLRAHGRLLPAACERLVHEAQAASALNHPNLVTVHEVLRFESGVAIVTEFVKGQSLRTLARAAMPIRQVSIWGGQIAYALAAAHAESIVHSDIKPENVEPLAKFINAIENRPLEPTAYL
jgi:serine/threonine protein kinase